MFKINLFYSIEYRRRIRNNMTLKMKVKVIWNQWHLKTIERAISDSLWICESNRRSICNFTRPWLYLPLAICINCRALEWEGVYVYKLAFFFWLSPRTYHFLFEKRLIIEWRYFWRNIALSLILERSPDYPLKENFRIYKIQNRQITLYIPVTHTLPLLAISVRPKNNQLQRTIQGTRQITVRSHQGGWVTPDWLPASPQTDCKVLNLHCQ